MDTNDITVLYEDNDILAVNKPAGIIVHSDGRTKEKTVVDWVIAHYPEIKGVGEHSLETEDAPIDRSGIVHRIDRETSGVLLIAKNNEAYEFLKDKFKNREISKVYRAFVVGVPRDPRGIIDREIKRSKTDFRKWTSFKGRGVSREATTQYRVIGSGNGIGYLELRPKTGRTHQIRVHLSSIGHPILCDTLYGARGVHNMGFDRVALHAYSVSFVGVDGKEIEVIAPFPDDFKHAEKELESFAK